MKIDINILNGILSISKSIFIYLKCQKVSKKHKINFTHVEWLVTLAISVPKNIKWNTHFQKMSLNAKNYKCTCKW